MDPLLLVLGLLCIASGAFSLKFSERFFEIGQRRRPGRDEDKARRGMQLNRAVWGYGGLVGGAVVVVLSFVL